MFDINEEEMERFYGKLYMLSNCMKIRKLGYGYEKGDYITIDFRIEDDDYGGYDQDKIMTDMLGTSIGCGYCQSNEGIIDDLRAIGAEIPYSLYDVDSIQGFTVKIDNKDTDKFIKYKLELDTDLKNSAKELSDSCFSGEGTVEDTQLIVDYENDGFYIIIPEEYVSIDCFFDEYCCFLEKLQKTIKKHEEKLKNEGEAA